MKSLFWKELTEARLVPLYLCFVGVALLSFHELVLFNLYLPIFCLATGLIAGCSSLSGETGRGTIKFLGSLPFERGQIWVCKAASTALVCYVASALGLICGLIGSNMAFSHNDNYSYIPTQLTTDITYALWWIVPVSIVYFGMACSFFMSTLVDRPLTAIILSCVAAIGLATVFLPMTGNLASTATGSAYTVLSCLIFDLISTVLMISSYFAFIRSKDIGLWRPAVSGSLFALSGVIVLGLLVSCWTLFVPATSEDSLVCNEASWELEASVPIPAPIWECQSAHINKEYTLNIPLQMAAAKAASAVTSNPALHVKVCDVLEGFDMAAQLHVDYQYTGAPGRATNYIRILDKSGATVEMETLRMSNVE